MKTQVRLVRRFSRKISRGASLIALFLSFTGCGSSSVPRFELSGTVTSKGQPVPAGFIIFAPDKSKGNNGPGAQAAIAAGKYQLPPDRGTIGGPHSVIIHGYDGVGYQEGPINNPNGKPLFKPATVEVDLPKSPATKNFSI